MFDQQGHKKYLFWGNEFPRGWDGTVLHSALQMVRCDQSSATGFAPAELMIGRPLVYPIQFSREDLDLTGTNMTVSLVKKLKNIREKNFKKLKNKKKKPSGEKKKIW